MIDIVRNSQNTDIPLRFLCSHFNVSSSGYYFWKQRTKSIGFVKKEKICDAIKKSFKDSQETYGSPRVYDDMKDMGLTVSENTVAKYMRELDLNARRKKKFKAQTTDSNHDSPIADRILRVEDHNTLPTAPGEVLAGDITYLRLGEGFVYLAVVLDIYSREIVGWSMQKTLHTQLILDALSSAMTRTGVDAKVIFHSDRGSQYASEAYRNFLKNSGMLPSMSRRGNCYDNSYVESWFGSLKKEWIYRKKYSTEGGLRALVFEYIEVWYNRKRKHSSLGYVSPQKFREIYESAH